MDDPNMQGHRAELETLKRQVEEKRQISAREKANKTTEPKTLTTVSDHGTCDKALRRTVLDDIDSGQNLCSSPAVLDSETEFQFNLSDFNSSDSELEGDSFTFHLRQKLNEDSDDSDEENDIPLSLLLQRNNTKSNDDRTSASKNGTPYVQQSMPETDNAVHAKQTEEVPPDSSRVDITPTTDLVKKKRKRNEKAWVRNVRKTKRNHGEMYVSRKGKEMAARQMKGGCHQNCRQKCHEKFDNDVRKEIFDEFWSLGSLTRQRDFILSRIKRENKKSTTSKPEANKERRQFHVYYTFMGENVCKKFFTGTLDISEQYIKTALKKLTAVGTSKDERRGRHGERANEVPGEKAAIRAHINSFPRVESHFCRKETGKEYLEGTLNKSLMYRLYKAEREELGMKPASFRTFHDIITYEYNISFHTRSKDKCSVCAEYENSCNKEREALEESFNNHKESKQKIFDRKEEDKKLAETNPSYSMAVFDLEEVLSTPKSNISDAYYLRKLNTYNLTVYEYETKDAFCYIWPEYTSSRGSNEIASCVFQYLQNIAANKRHIILYSDCCTGQNRNRYILTMLWYAITKFDFEYIEHKFLLTGHSFNEGDSVHSAIERASKDIDVYTPTHWGIVIQNASHRRNYHVKEMILDDFFDFKELSKSILNFEVDSQGNKVTWLKIRSMKLKKNNPNIVEIKYKVDSDPVILNLFQKGRRSIDVPENPVLKQLNMFPIKIDADKYKDLQKMCDKKMIPRAHHDYYKGLPHW